MIRRLRDNLSEIGKLSSAVYHDHKSANDAMDGCLNLANECLEMVPNERVFRRLVAYAGMHLEMHPYDDTTDQSLEAWLRLVEVELKQQPAD